MPRTFMLAVTCSGADCGGCPGGRTSFPEAAHMFVSPTFLHMRASQHPPGSSGGHQAQARRRAAEGEQRDVECIQSFI